MAVYRRWKAKLSGIEVIKSDNFHMLVGCVLSILLMGAWWVYGPRRGSRRNTLLFWFLLSFAGLLGPLIGGLNAFH